MNPIFCQSLLFELLTLEYCRYDAYWILEFGKIDGRLLSKYLLLSTLASFLFLLHPNYRTSGINHTGVLSGNLCDASLGMNLH